MGQILIYFMREFARVEFGGHGRGRGTPGLNADHALWIGRVRLRVGSRQNHSF